MKLQLIQGNFTQKEAIELIVQMVHVKIKYHEKQINNNSTEEDIKARESKIKQLQKELFELRQNLNSKGQNVKIEAFIDVE
jgi:hypothetical protein